MATTIPTQFENFKSSSHCTSRWMVHSSVLSDMDGHQESQFEWLSAKLLSGSKVKECWQVQHLVHNFIVGTLCKSIFHWFLFHPTQPSLLSNCFALLRGKARPRVARGLISADGSVSKYLLRIHFIGRSLSRGSGSPQVYGPPILTNQWKYLENGFILFYVSCEERVGMCRPHPASSESRDGSNVAFVGASSGQ